MEMYYDENAEKFQYTSSNSDEIQMSEDLIDCLVNEIKIEFDVYYIAEKETRPTLTKSDYLDEFLDDGLMSDTLNDTLLWEEPYATECGFQFTYETNEDFYYKVADYLEKRIIESISQTL